MVASLQRVHRLHEAKRAHLLDSDGPSPVPAAESVPPDDTAPAATNQGKIIFLYSGKGGVGKSLIAVNLAVSMAKETRARVALVDLDLQFGDIAMLLNLDASHGISDLIENIDHLDHAFIQEIMVDGPLGLKLLLAPVRPELADLVMVDHVWRILSELRDMFDYIVVDSNGNLDDINLELIDLAHRIVVVTVLAIRSEADGDLHIRVQLYPPFRGMLTAGNQQQCGQGICGLLVVEPICVHAVTQADAVSICAADPDPVKSLPAVGAHIWLEGRSVRDLDHSDWAELHPLYRWGPD